MLGPAESLMVPAVSSSIHAWRCAFGIGASATFAGGRNVLGRLCGATSTWRRVRSSRVATLIEPGLASARSTSAHVVGSRKAARTVCAEDWSPKPGPGGQNQRSRRCR